MNNWEDHFIQYDAEYNQYIAYDEAQAYEIGSYDTWDEAAIAVREYAKTI